VLQRLFILAAGETANANDQTLVIDAFNDWVNGLFADGLTPYADETATTPTALTEGTTYTSSSNFPFLDRHFEGVAAILAVDLAPDFEADLRPSTVRSAEVGWQRLRAAFILDSAWEMTLDRQMYRFPNRNNWSAVE
jgi:hypothetical protein